MNLVDYITEKRVFLDFNASDKSDFLVRAVEKIVENSDCVTNPSVFLSALKIREGIVSTGIGDGVAVAHCKTDAVNDIVIALFVLDGKIEYEAIDDKPVDIVFVIGIPPTHIPDYLKILSKLSYELRNFDNLEALKKSQNAKEALEVLRKMS